MTFAPLERISVYIHIPLCRARCDYCDFFTRVGISLARQTELIDAIAQQARHTLHALGDPSIDTLYIGGGTPTSLAPDPLARLLATVRALLRSATPDVEVTFEANPEDLQRELLMQLTHAGVTRLSVGVQSLTDAVLRRIGRHSDARQTARGIDALTRWWGGRLSLDLIAAVDYTDEHAAQRDLHGVVAALPDHVSLYELTVEPHTRLAQRRSRTALVRDRGYEDRALAHLAAVRALLQRHGFAQYEVSNYAIPGFESRHNHAYWRADPVLGLGPGAAGTLPTSVGPLRTNGLRTFDAFLSADPLRRWSVEALSLLELGEELFMGGLRTSNGVSLHRIRRLFGQDLGTLLPLTLHRHASLFELDRNRVRLRPQGLNVIDAVLVDLFDELAGRVDRDDTLRWPIA